MRPLIITGEIARKAICRYVQEAPEGHVVTIKEPARNLDQNARMWASLSDIERQCDWHGMHLTSEEWKDLLSAGLCKSKVVPNIESTGFVILGQRTSKMSRRQFAELIELIQHFGDSRGVQWTEQSTEIAA